MEHQNIEEHSNILMALKGFVLSLIAAFSVEKVTGEAIHIFFICFGTIVVFLLQKALHFLWDKYVKKNGNK